MAKHSVASPAPGHLQDLDVGAAPPKPRAERILDVVERVGNSVPHPAIIFVLLIGLVILLSHVVYLLGAGVTYQAVNPETLGQTLHEGGLARTVVPAQQDHQRAGHELADACCQPPCGLGTACLQLQHQR